MGVRRAACVANYGRFARTKWLCGCIDLDRRFHSDRPDLQVANGNTRCPLPSAFALGGRAGGKPRSRVGPAVGEGPIFLCIRLLPKLSVPA
jgi:hypothetical protein